jgi:hypothetical protein
VSGREAIRSAKAAIVKERPFTLPYELAQVSPGQNETLAALHTYLTSHHWIPTGSLTGIEWHPPGTTTKEPITARPASRLRLNWPATHAR